jgi:hypothetical protein
MSRVGRHLINDLPFPKVSIGSACSPRTRLLPAENRHERIESERFKCFPYDDLAKRDKVNLDIFWLKDESLEDSANLPVPDIIAGEIMEDLQAALEQFSEIAGDLITAESHTDTTQGR